MATTEFRFNTFFLDIYCRENQLQRKGYFRNVHIFYKSICYKIHLQSMSNRCVFFSILKPLEQEDNLFLGFAAD